LRIESGLRDNRRPLFFGRNFQSWSRLPAFALERRVGLADIQHAAPRGEGALLSALKRIPPTEIPFAKMVIARRDDARRRTRLAAIAAPGPMGQNIIL